jgi:uncharacterized coiled-coil protein SlyX
MPQPAELNILIENSQKNIEQQKNNINALIENVKKEEIEKQDNKNVV